MVYKLNITERNQIKSWIPLIPDYYAEVNAVQITAILQDAINTGSININDIYTLMELLPLIVPQSVMVKKDCENEENSEWSLYINEQQANYRREIERLRYSITNWIFIHNTVYCSDQRSAEGLERKALSSGITSETGINR